MPVVRMPTPLRPHADGLVGMGPRLVEVRVSGCV